MNDLIPSEQDFKTLEKLGGMAVRTGFLPSSINTPEKAIIIALKGRELGIPPMQAFAQISVIQGKPTISAELMMALVYKNVPQAEIIFDQNDNKGCVIRSRRRKDQSFSRFEFNENDAKTAGLLGKSTWKTYPAAMYRARAISIMARAMFADAISGCSYTPEELGATVTEEGDVINVTPQKEEIYTSGSAENTTLSSNVTSNTFAEVNLSLGEPVDPQPGVETSNPQTYVIPFGKDKGTRIIDIPIPELKKRRDWFLSLKTRTLSEKEEEFCYIVDLMDDEPNPNFPAPDFSETDVRY